MWLGKYFTLFEMTLLITLCSLSLKTLTVTVTVVTVKKLHSAEIIQKLHSLHWCDWTERLCYTSS